MLPAAEVAFGPYLLDSRSRSLSRGGEPVGLSPHEFEVLHLLVRRSNVVVSKDALIRAGWHDTAVGDNSLEKLVGKLRLGPRVAARATSRVHRRPRGPGIAAVRPNQYGPDHLRATAAAASR